MFDQNADMTPLSMASIEQIADELVRRDLSAFCLAVERPSNSIQVPTLYRMDGNLSSVMGMGTILHDLARSSIYQRISSKPDPSDED